LIVRQIHNFFSLVDILFDNQIHLLFYVIQED